MPAFTYRTLGDLRQELRVRLGFGATGASQAANSALLDSFLQKAQETIYWLQDWKKLLVYDDQDLGADQNLLDYPATINPERLVPPGKSRSPIWVQVNARWIPMSEGINEDMWDTMETNTSYSCRYELYDQIQFWPRNDSLRTVRIWGIKRLERFTQDTDRCTLDDSLVFLHALAHAKAHYQRPDAPTYMDQWNAILDRLKGAQIGSNGVFRRGSPTDTPIPKPVVV